MRAHWRPSLIAHTISDCPRRASPAANTPSTEVVYGLTALTLPRGSFSTPSWSSSSCSGCRKPIASSTSCAGSSRSVPGTGANGGAGCAWAMCSAATRAAAVVGEARWS